VPLVATWLLTGAAAPPGDHHVGATLKCADCHVMHYSQSHGYQPNGSDPFRPLGPGPNRSLLRNDLTDTCLSCHDLGGFATDVLGTNTGSQLGIVRSGGYLNRLGMVGLPETGHTLDSLANAPGSSPPWNASDENGVGQGLTCVNCHAPHAELGTGHPTGSQFRNLRSDPGHASSVWVTYNGTEGLNDLSRDVYLRDFDDYDESQLDWNEPDSQDSAIARWCGGCHNDIHDNWLLSSIGGSGTPGTSWFERHPVFDDDLDSEQLDEYNPKANKVKVMSEVGIWDPAGFDVTPTCVTCHRGHGNGNPFGLIYRSGTGTPTEDGDSNGSTVDHLCLQCHAEGSSFGSDTGPFASTPLQ
jgi:hypothetical protein